MVPICLVPGWVFPNSSCFSHKMRGLLDILSLALALGSVSQPDIPLGTRQPVKGWPNLFHSWMRICSASPGLCRRHCVLRLRIAVPDCLNSFGTMQWVKCRDVLCKPSASPAVPGMTQRGVEWKNEQELPGMESENLLVYEVICIFQLES